MAAKVRYRHQRKCWEADYRDSSGRRRRITAETREKAEDLLADAIRESRRPAPEKDPDTRLADYARQWLEDVRAEGVLAKGTVEGYEYNLTKHVIPSMGHFRIREIRPSAVKALLRRKREAGLGKNSVRLIRAALSVVLSDAVDDGLLESNPAISNGGRRKRHGAMTQKDRLQNVRPMSWEQRERFLEEAHRQDSLHGTLFELMVKTGLRPGEALALKVDDLNLTERKLRVERAVRMGEVKETKTGDARDVDLSSELVGLLKNYVAELRKETLRNGWGEPSWLFPSVTNTPLDPANVAKVFRSALKKAGLPKFRLYDLRHTCASLLLARCAPITFVAAQLGHSKPTTTLTYYARWIPSEGQSFADLLDSVPVPQGGTLPGFARTAVPKERFPMEPKDLEPKVEPNAVLEVANSGKSLSAFGEPRRNRTFNLQIKSLLLCQLS